MNALILTAGLGSRFLPFTQTVPKPAVPLLNVPLVFYSLHLLQQLELSSVTFNIHHLASEMMETIANSNKIKLPVFFSDERELLLGTGGAILHARNHLGGKGSFAVANSDTVIGYNILDFQDHHYKNEPMATLLVMKHPEAGKKYGAVWADKKGKVVDFGKKKPDSSCTPYHYLGVQLIEESVFKYIPEGPCDILRDVYRPAIKKGEVVQIYEKSGLWLECGEIQDYLNATKTLIEILSKLQHHPFFLSFYNRYWNDFEKRPSIWEGINCHHQLPLVESKSIVLGNDCRVHPTARINGFAVLGNNVKVENGAKIENSVIADNVVVTAGRKIKDTLVLV